MKRALLLFLLLPLAACVSVGIGGEPVAQASYALRDEAAVARREAPLVSALLIQSQPADALADTAAIAYSKRPGEYGFYQFASWTERPVRQLPRLLQRRLEARGLAGAVGLVGDPLRSDWLLTIAIDTLHQDLRAEPGLERLVLTLELFDRRSRVRVARRSFDIAVACERADSAAAAQSASQAVAQAFDVAVPWLETELQRASATAR